MTPAVLAIDGGNTKSVAVVATTEGTVLGHALGGCGDIYGARKEDDALDTLAGIAVDALAGARVAPDQVQAMAASVAGADWPEDFELFERELLRKVGLSCPTLVINDGLGPLRLGDPSGIGVAIVLGTGVAIGARGSTGKTWNASFWLPFSMTTLCQRALQAVYRWELGLAPATAMTERLLGHFGLADVEGLLHGFTRRAGRIPSNSKQDVGILLLEEDAAGDEVARNIVDSFVAELADYALVAARKAEVISRFPLVLTGGVLQNRVSRLAERVATQVQKAAEGAEPVLPTVAPVAGAVLEAIALANGGTVSKELHQRVLATPVLHMLTNPCSRINHPPRLTSKRSF